MRHVKLLPVVLLLIPVLHACRAPEPSATPEPEPEAAAEPILVALPPAGQAEDGASQIAGALHAAPNDLREGAAVLGYDGGGSLVTLRPGSNSLVCLADSPGDDRFQVACYQRELEPFMARGRELRAQGVTGPDSINTRHQEIEAGTLPMPDAPAAVYTFGGDLEIFDPATGEVDGGRMIYALYTPYETEESTGLSTTPAFPGAPWIMRPGTPSSHIMVTPPAQ